MEGLDRTIIEGGDGFGGASMLAGGAALLVALFWALCGMVVLAVVATVTVPTV